MLLPHAADNVVPGFPLFENGIYLGQPIKCAETGNDASLFSHDELDTRILDPDVIIGTSRSFRDDGTRERYVPGTPEPENLKDYTYVELTEADYNAMMDAGMNIFRVPLEHLPWVIDRPVWFLVRGGFDDRPDILYRSNFFGAVMYMDEPAISGIENEIFTQQKSPQRVASLLVDIARGRHHGVGTYGMYYLDRLLERDGWDLGDSEILQPDYPVWETVPSSAWYQMEAGVPGFLYEGRHLPKEFARMVKAKVGVDFPETPEAGLRFNTAFIRSASRHFGGRWGVSLYGQTASDASEKMFPLAYDEGATYFWFWTSDSGHHIPFEEQLTRSRQLREYAKSHPRKKSPEELTASARTAIALPWGYQMDHIAFTPYSANEFPVRHMMVPRGQGMIWSSPYMELRDNNGRGATYGDVLAAAMKETVPLLEDGILFDFVFPPARRKN